MRRVLLIQLLRHLDSVYIQVSFDCLNDALLHFFLVYVMHIGRQFLFGCIWREIADVNVLLRLVLFHRLQNRFRVSSP